MMPLNSRIQPIRWVLLAMMIAALPVLTAGRDVRAQELPGSRDMVPTYAGLDTFVKEKELCTTFDSAGLGVTYRIPESAAQTILDQLQPGLFVPAVDSNGLVTLSFSVNWPGARLTYTTSDGLQTYSRLLASIPVVHLPTGTGLAAIVAAYSTTPAANNNFLRGQPLYLRATFEVSRRDDLVTVTVTGDEDDFRFTVRVALPDLGITTGLDLASELNFSPPRKNAKFCFLGNPFPPAEMQCLDSEQNRYRRPIDPDSVVSSSKVVLAGQSVKLDDRSGGILEQNAAGNFAFVERIN